MSKSTSPAVNVSSMADEQGFLTTGDDSDSDLVDGTGRCNWL